MASFIFNFNRPLWMKNKRVAWAFLDAKDEHLFIYGNTSFNSIVDMHVSLPKGAIFRQ